MALIGLSLVLASAVYIAIWRPPLVQTLMALWRGDPRIEQSPGGRKRSSPSPDGRAVATTEDTTPATRVHRHEVPSISIPRADTPPLPVEHKSNGSANASQAASPSPQTTPKANAAQPNRSIPTLSLSPEPPASAAAVARIADSTSTPATLSSLSAAAPTSLSEPASLSVNSTTMAPPPRPSTLSNVNNSSLLHPRPSRPTPQPNRLQPQQRRQHDRQPGTSTLAPPPTHSSKPAKPSRKVTLEPGHSPLDWARVANHPIADLRGLGPGAPYLRVTPSMLRRQTGRKGKDAWTALGSRVYNISPYLPFHPGGEPELLRAAGRDGTKLFGEIHPWVNYETMLSSSLIGLMVEEGEERSAGELDDMD